MLSCLRPVKKYTVGQLPPKKKKKSGSGRFVLQPLTQFSFFFFFFMQQALASNPPKPSGGRWAVSIIFSLPAMARGSITHTAYWPPLLEAHYDRADAAGNLQ